MNLRSIRILVAALLSFPCLIATASGDAVTRAAEQMDAVLAATPMTLQTASMVDLTQQPPAAAQGAAFLTRAKSRLRAQVMLADLIPGHAYTVWWLIFNNPAGCSATPCTPGPDFGTGRAAIHFATGAIASAGGGVGGDGGVVNATFETDVGGPPAGAVVIPDGPENGLTPGNGFAAEVHLLMLDHGVPNADLGGGPGTWPVELSTPLPPGVADVRAVFFAPTAP